MISITGRGAGLAAALLFAAATQLDAQDIIISAAAARGPYAPDELPVLKSAPHLAFPDELKKTADIGYVVYHLALDGKGRILGLSPHATLAAYERVSRGDQSGYTWSPGKRDGKGVNTETSFAVIFNPASAAEGKPDSTPRLLDVATVTTRLKGRKRHEIVPDRVAWAEVMVNESGGVAGLKDAPAGLEHDFEIAAKNWRFAPARRAGVAVASEVRVPFVIVTERPEPAGGEKVPPRVLSQERPIYPFAMRANGMRGEVIVDFIVDIEGRVRQPYVVRSLNPSFDDAAVDAVRQWKFEPARVGPRPVNMHMQVPVIFALDETFNGGKGPMTEPKKADLSKLPPEFRYDTPPKPSGTVRVVYPYALLRARKAGKAVVGYVVGKNGQVSHADIREASMPEFGLAVRAAIECFTFEPAIKAGSPSLALGGFRQEFDLDEELQLVSSEDLALLRREEKKPESILTLRQLDAMPVPLSRRPPRFPTSLAGKVASGEALIEILIDEEGRARLPRIVSATEDAFGYAAVQSVATWRFEPPTRGGRAVVARAQIPVKFGAVSSSSGK